MMFDWNQYRQQLAKRIADLGRQTPGTMRGYRELSQAGAQTARLDDKTRELIAIAVGVTRQCDGCITTHVAAARKHGATPEEITEALGVAIAVNAARRWSFPPARWTRSRPTTRPWRVRASGSGRWPADVRRGRARPPRCRATTGCRHGRRRGR
jgi:AhpD family alkylhydroperoxidase